MYSPSFLNQGFYDHMNICIMNLKRKYRYLLAYTVRSSQYINSEFDILKGIIIKKVCSYPVISVHLLRLCLWLKLNP